MKRRTRTKPGYAVTYPYVFPDDPVCVMGPNGMPCRGCHWCLRARFGALYWLRGQSA